MLSCEFRQDLMIKDTLDKDTAVAYALYDDTVDENGYVFIV